MKKYINILLTAVVLGFGSVLTADAQSNRDFRPDYDYYDDEFDWRWDVRVRISDGINSGLITRSEANRLYRKLEDIEQKEYAYAADGFYDSWEQDDVWRDVQWLNSRVGLELRDFDRTYYGFNPIGIAFTGYPSWWYNGGYNFYRFDRRGWGSIRIGYTPRYFVPRWVPNRTIYVKNYRNHGHRYYRTGNRNRVVQYERYANNRNVTNTPRSNRGRSNGTVYNRNNDSRQRTAVTPNSRIRSSSIDRSATTRRSATIGSRSATPNRSTARSRSSSSESLNRTNSSSSRSGTISRPSTSSSRVATPSRSRAGSSPSVNRSSRTSSSRSTPKSSYSRSSSSTSRSAVSRSSAGRTKAPEPSRSSSRSGSRNNE